jgi:hypothetical protein
MRKILRSRVAAVSIGALVVVGLGAGGATAAGMIDSDNIRNNSIQQTDLGRDSVGKSELKADSVGPRYLTDNLLDRINETAQDGADGDDGDDGKDGVSGYERVSSTQEFGPGGFGWTTCPEGKMVVGGGYKFETPADLSNGTGVAASFPAEKGEVLGTPPNTVTIDGSAGVVQPNKPVNVNPGEITVYAVCAKVAY